MNLSNIIPSDFSGCILVTKKNETILESALGYSDIPNKIQNKINTRYATASAGKVFTAIGILKLIETGRLSFCSTIGTLLDFDLKAVDPDITVEQLLTHTSGIPDYFNESVMEDYAELWRDFPNYRIRTSADLIPLFINKPMMHPKGDRFRYNNTGFVVLGLITEAVTGMRFDEYLHREVFVPCGMKDTGYYELDRLPERCANSYIYDKARCGWYTNIYSVDAKGSGAGGAYTTVRDVHSFWECLIAGKLLSDKMVKNMLSLHAGGGNKYYGYGIWLDKQPDSGFTPFFEGCDPGVSFISGRELNGTIFTAVSNLGQNVWKIRRELQEKLRLLND